MNDSEKLNRALIIWILNKMYDKMNITPQEWDDLHNTIQSVQNGEYDGRINELLESVREYIYLE